MVPMTPAELLESFTTQVRLTDRDTVPGHIVERDGPVHRSYPSDPGQRGAMIECPEGLGEDPEHWIARQVAFFTGRGQRVEWKTYSTDPVPRLQERLTAAGFVAEEAEVLMLGELADEKWVRNTHLDAMGIAGTPEGGMNRLLVKMGNRDLTGQDFGWFWESRFREISWPEDVVVIERREWGNFYGRLLAVKENGHVIAQGDAVDAALSERLARADAIIEQVQAIEKGDMGALNYRMEELRLTERRLALEKRLTAEVQADIEAERAEINSQFDVLQKQLQELNAQANRDALLQSLSTVAKRKWRCHTSSR